MSVISESATAGGFRHDVEGETDPIVDAVERQAAAALRQVRDTDPQAWLFLERSRYLTEGHCDPFAEQMLRQAGFLPSL